MSISHRYSEKSVSIGFSLLEILLVLGMVGIVSSLAITTFRQGVGNPGLSSQVQEVQAVFDAARSHAVKTNTPTCVALRTEMPSEANRNQCSTVVEYYYSLSRAESLECSIFGKNKDSTDIQFHKKSVPGLAYTLMGVSPFAIISGCPFYYVRTFTFQPGSGFLKAGGSNFLTSYFASNEGFIEFFNPAASNSNHWRFRVERSGVLTLSKGG